MGDQSNSIVCSVYWSIVYIQIWK